MKLAHLPYALAPLAAVLLVACQQQEAAAPVEQNPEAKPGLSASDGVFILPAVKGNPGAAYFSLFNNGGQAVSVAGVSINAAESAEIHETRDGKMASVDQVEVAPGATINFERGGLHVMAFGIKPELAAGSPAEITLTFSDGDKLSAPLKVQSAGMASAHDGGAEH